MMQLCVKWWEDRMRFQYCFALQGVDEVRNAQYEVLEYITHEAIAYASREDLQYLYLGVLEQLTRAWSHVAGFNIYLVPAGREYILAEAMDIVIEGEWYEGTPADSPRLYKGNAGLVMSYVPRPDGDEVSRKRHASNTPARVPSSPSGWR